MTYPADPSRGLDAAACRSARWWSEAAGGAERRGAELPAAESCASARTRDWQPRCCGWPTRRCTAGAARCPACWWRVNLHRRRPAAARSVLTYGVRQLFRPVARLPLARRIWRHSLATAILAADIRHGRGTATRWRLHRGLLHDIGRLDLSGLRPRHTRGWWPGGRSAEHCLQLEPPARHDARRGRRTRPRTRHRLPPRLAEASARSITPDLAALAREQIRAPSSPPAAVWHGRQRLAAIDRIGRRRFGPRWRAGRPHALRPREGGGDRRRARPLLAQQLQRAQASRSAASSAEDSPDRAARHRPGLRRISSASWHQAARSPAPTAGPAPPRSTDTARARRDRSATRAAVRRRSAPPAAGAATRRRAGRARRQTVPAKPRPSPQFSRARRWPASFARIRCAESQRQPRARLPLCQSGYAASAAA